MDKINRSQKNFFILVFIFSVIGCIWTAANFFAFLSSLNGCLAGGVAGSLGGISLLYLQLFLLCAAGILLALFAPSKLWSVWAFSWWGIGIVGVSGFMWLYRHSMHVPGIDAYAACGGVLFVWCMLAVAMTYFKPRVRYWFAGGYLVCILIFLLVILPFALQASFE